MRRLRARCMMICRTASRDYLHEAGGSLENGPFQQPASLAAAHRMRYATPGKLIHFGALFGALDDLRRH
jgi:hypothetical protein